ncbi:MAG: hypothetical protein ACRD4L_10920, partial [Pyrinomonadaceae bacterium]
VTYFDQPNCYKISNDTVEVIVTTDIGPRIIRYAFKDGENIFAEIPLTSEQVRQNIWHPYGGHRLWHAPEAIPRSYEPDNSPIKFKIEGNNTIRLTQAIEPNTRIQKEMVITLDEKGSGVTVRHFLTNRGLWPVNMAPWAMSIMNGGGTTIFPQEPYRSHDDYLLPARPMVMWHYTNLSDPRWKIGPKFIRLSTDAAMKEPQKVAIANKQNWAAYAREGNLFIDRFAYREGAIYADYGSNTETYTTGTFMEIESLGPLEVIEPEKTVEHIERWYLYKDVQIGNTEETLETALKPLLAQSPMQLQSTP